MNCIHLQLAMLAHNLNCWLMLFNREEEAKVDALRHTTLWIQPKRDTRRAGGRTRQRNRTIGFAPIGGLRGAEHGLPSSFPCWADLGLDR